MKIELADAIRVVDGQQFEFHRAIGVKRKENGEKEYWATNPPANMSLPSNLANYVIKQINDNKIPMYPEQSLLWISFLQNATIPISRKINIEGFGNSSSDFYYQISNFTDSYML